VFPSRRLRRRYEPLMSLLARASAPRLDRQLASGTPPWRSPVHVTRALQLTNTHRRQLLALGLERLVSDSQRVPRGPRLGGAVAPCRAQVTEALPLILGLIARLRDRTPVDARGMAQLSQLLTDGAGPCYVSGDSGWLSHELESAWDAL